MHDRRFNDLNTIELFEGKTLHDVKRCAVVLGSGRSGTSLITQVLSANGVKFDSDLTARGDQNPLGDGEDPTIHALHSEIIRSHSMRHMPVDPRVFTQPELESLKRRLAAYVADKSTFDCSWGFKDPRTSALLPMWKTIFNSKAISPKYILCVRNPAHVITSFGANFGDTPEAAQLTWLSRNLESLVHTGLNVFVIHYEDILENPFGSVTELLGFIKDGTESVVPENVNVEDLIRRDLNRAALSESTVTNKLVLEFYDALLECKGSNFDKERLGKCVRDMNEIHRTFLPWPYAAGLRIERARRASGRIEQDETFIAQKRLLEESRAELGGVLEENSRLMHTNAELQCAITTARRIAQGASETAERLSKEKLMLEKEAVRRDLEKSKMEKEVERLFRERKTLEGTARTPRLSSQEKNKIRNAAERRLKDSFAFRIGRSFTIIRSKPVSGIITLPYHLARLSYLALRARLRTRSRI